MRFTQIDIRTALHGTKRARSWLKVQNAPETTNSRTFSSE